MEGEPEPLTFQVWCNHAYHFTALPLPIHNNNIDLRHFCSYPSDQLINQALCESSIIMLTTRPQPAHNNDKDLRHFGSCPSDQLINQTLCASSRMVGSRLSDYFEKNLNGAPTTDERLTGVQQPFVLRGTIAFHQRPLVKICQLLGSGGGSVGRAVASYTRGPRFDSHRWH